MKDHTLAYKHLHGEFYSIKAKLSETDVKTVYVERGLAEVFKALWEDEKSKNELGIAGCGHDGEIFLPTNLIGKYDLNSYDSGAIYRVRLSALKQIVEESSLHPILRVELNSKIDEVRKTRTTKHAADNNINEFTLLGDYAVAFLEPLPDKKPAKDEPVALVEDKKAQASLHKGKVFAGAFILPFILNFCSENPAISFALMIVVLSAAWKIFGSEAIKNGVSTVGNKFVEAILEKRNQQNQTLDAAVSER